MLENIAEYYKKSNGKTKKKILGCIFSEKMVLEKGKAASYEFALPIQVLVSASKVFTSLESIDFKGVRWNLSRKPGIRFKNLDKKKRSKLVTNSIEYH